MAELFSRCEVVVTVCHRVWMGYTRDWESIVLAQVRRYHPP